MKLLLQVLAPAIRDRKSAVAAECTRADFGSRRVLPPFVLGSIGEQEYPLYIGSRQPFGSEFGHRAIAMNVAFDDCVEECVIGQGI